MTLVYSMRFARAASALPKDARAKLPKALMLLATDPTHPGLQTKKIQGVASRDIFEAGLDQRYRFTYEIQGDIVVFRNIDDRDACLQSP